MDELQFYELEESLLKLKKRKLDLDFEELELRKKRATLAIESQKSSPSRQLNRARNTGITTTPVLTQSFMGSTSNDSPSRTEEALKKAENMNTLTGVVKDRAPGTRPQRSAVQYENPRSDIKEDQPRGQFHFGKRLSSTPEIAETCYDVLSTTNEQLRASNVTSFTVLDIDASYTSHVAESTKQPTEAKSKAYRRGKLFKEYTYLGANFDAWTYPEWWEQIGERLVSDSTSLLDILVKCRANHPETWNPLEFLQRASFASILRQAGMCNTKYANERKIISRDLNFANDNPAIYTERAYWSRSPDFQRVLEEEMLVDVGGLYWRLEEMPENYHQLLKTGGVPDHAEDFRSLSNDGPSKSMPQNHSARQGSPSANFHPMGSHVSSSGMSRLSSAPQQTQSRKMREHHMDESKNLFLGRTRAKSTDQLHDPGNETQNSTSQPVEWNSPTLARTPPKTQKRPRRFYVEDDDSDYECSTEEDRDHIGIV